jgi:hypothetical protein
MLTCRRYNVHLDTLEDQPLSRHEARPLAGGVKFACNKWLHTDNYYDNYIAGILD